MPGTHMPPGAHVLGAHPGTWLRHAPLASGLHPWGAMGVSWTWRCAHCRLRIHRAYMTHNSVDARDCMPAALSEGASRARGLLVVLREP